MILAVGIAVLGFHSLQASIDEAKRQTAQIILTRDAHAHVLQAMAYVAAAAATNEPAIRQQDLDIIKTQRAAYKADLDALKVLATTEDTQRMLAELDAAIATARDSNTQLMASAEAGKQAEAIRSGLMTRIHDTIGNVTSLVREIGSATREQFSTAAEIARRMDESAREVGQNATATQELAATVKEITRTARALAQVSETMATAVAKFQV
jgi:methyl-accepting chemotaxis protein